jgi:phosphonate transport system ATP-binding protein
VIRLEDVSVTYPGRVRALRPVTLEFSPGDVTVLLGASGAGKSTLLRCLNLLAPLSSGRVITRDLGALVDRKAIREHRRRTGMIYQQHQLMRRHTALRNTLVGRLGYHSTLRSLAPLPVSDHRLALAALERVGLLEQALVRVDNLSGGQQQRVGIARALAQQPRFMLADEPVASLDPTAADGVLALLRLICREDRMGAVVSLHQVHLARRFADRIVGLAGGLVVFDGPPEALGPDVLGAIYPTTRREADVRSPHPDDDQATDVVAVSGNHDRPRSDGMLQRRLR